MYNYTNGDPVWRERLQGFIDQSEYFFPESYNRTLLEACEIPQKCNIDQLSFKGYLARWLAVAVQLAPFTAPQVIPHLQRSGKAAAQTCIASDGVPVPYKCGNRWYHNGYDGNSGVGQQLAALSVITANLVTVAEPPKNVHTGGESQGDPSLGTGGILEAEYLEFPDVTIGDKAGASVVTALVVMFMVGGGCWMVYWD